VTAITNVPSATSRSDFEFLLTENDSTRCAAFCAPINQVAKLAFVLAKAGVNTFRFASRKLLPFNLRGLPYVRLDDVTKHLQKFVGTLSMGNPGQS
jgi:hypothetical protein